MKVSERKVLLELIDQLNEAMTKDDEQMPRPDLTSYSYSAAYRATLRLRALLDTTR